MTIRVGLRHVGRPLRVPPPLCEFRSGFETGDVSEWDAASNGPTVAGAHAHHGDYGAQFSKAPGSDGYIRKTVDNVNPLFFTARVKLTAFSDASSVWLVLLTLGRWAYEWALIGVEYDPSTFGDSNLHLRAVAWDWDGNDHPFELLSDMALNKWYLLEMGLYRHVSLGWMKGWVNTSFKDQITGIDNHFTSYPDHCAGVMYYSVASGSVSTALIDCCCIAKKHIRIDPYS